MQGAKLTTSHWTHVTEGCNNKASHCNHHHWTSMVTVECTMQQYICAPYMFSSQALTEVALVVASCTRIVLMLVLIWSIVVVVVVSSVVAASLSNFFCSDAGQDVCTLCLRCFFLSSVANIYLIQFHYALSISTCANTA